MVDGLQQQAGVHFREGDGRAGGAALQQLLAAGHAQPAHGLLTAVAGEAALLQDRNGLLGEPAVRRGRGGRRFRSLWRGGARQQQACADC